MFVMFCECEVTPSVVGQTAENTKTPSVAQTNTTTQTNETTEQTTTQTPPVVVGEARYTIFFRY